jgi:hypothetical protein
LPCGKRPRRLPGSRAYPGGQLPVGAVSLDGRAGSSGALGGDGYGHHPLDVALRVSGGADRAASANRAHGLGGDSRSNCSGGHLRAHGSRDDCLAQCVVPVCVPVRERFAPRFSLGLAVPLDGSANAAALSTVLLRPFFSLPLFTNFVEKLSEKPRVCLQRNLTSCQQGTFRPVSLPYTDQFHGRSVARTPFRTVSEGEFSEVHI